MIRLVLLQRCRRYDELLTFRMKQLYLHHHKKDKNAKAVAPRKQPTPVELDTLKLKKAWELAIAPAKQLPMNAIGMYMTGNSLQIFSIMMVFMLFKTPLTAIMNVQNTFSKLESERTKDQFIMVKLCFIACNLLAVGLGVWKVDKMGLLPYVPLTDARGKDVLTSNVGRRDQIGWHGRRRENRSRGRIRCGQHRRIGRSECVPWFVDLNSVTRIRA